MPRGWGFGFVRRPRPRRPFRPGTGCLKLTGEVARDLTAVDRFSLGPFGGKRPDASLGVLEVAGVSEVGTSPCCTILKFGPSCCSMRDLGYFLGQAEELDDFRNELVDRGTPSKALQGLKRWIHQLVELRDLSLRDVLLHEPRSPHRLRSLVMSVQRPVQQRALGRVCCNRKLERRTGR